MNTKTIDLYEQIAEITNQMLAAARQGDWNSLIALENRCADHVNTLREKGTDLPLTAGAREKKISIIKKILADDHEIRAITEPRLAQLASLIASSDNAHKLNRAYSANSST
jgi:flagellar protein FliT